MAPTSLHLLQGGDNAADDARRRLPRPCRRSGCAEVAAGTLGFCDGCLTRYERRAAGRRRLVDLVCDRLASVGDPLFAVFGTRSRAFGAHVVAHLEELDAQHIHVPPTAVSDYIAELDDQDRRSG